MMDKRKQQKESWRKANLEKQNGYRIKSLYGMTVEEKYHMLLKQNNCCKICKTKFQTEKKHRPHIDHDHATGKVRGLLCDYCNRGLGAFKDNVRHLFRAIFYLLASR